MEFVKAGPNKRVCAFLIDNGLASTFSLWMFVVFKSQLANWISWTVLMLFKDAIDGRSPGKRFAGIQVLDEQGNPPRLSQTLFRNLFLVIPIFPVVEYIVMLKDKQEGKRVGDKLAKTRVGDLKPLSKDITYLWFSMVVVIILAAIQVSAALYISKKYPWLLIKTRSGIPSLK